MSILRLAPLALIASPCFASDWTVSPSDDLQAVLDAAAPGDRVFLLPGLHQDPSGFVVDKGLELIGSGSESCTLRAKKNDFLLLTPLRVTGVGPGERARVSGVTLDQTATTSVNFISYGLLGVYDCDGLVELSDVIARIQYRGFGQEPGGVIGISNCAQVVASDVHLVEDLFAPGLGWSSPEDTAYDGLLVVDSTVWLQASSLQASVSLPLFGLSPGAGGSNGIRAVRSDLTIARTSAIGRIGGASVDAIAGAAGAGLLLEDSRATVHGGTDNLLEGGAAAEWNPTLLSSAGAGVKLDATSALTYASDVVFKPGIGDGILPAGLDIDAVPGAAVQALATRLPSFVVTPSVAPPGGAVTIEVEGNPGAVHLRIVGLRTAPALAISGVDGALLVDLGAAWPLATVTLDGEGRQSFASVLPDAPSFAGLGLVEQGLEIGPAGLIFSPAALFLIAP